jgi:hypothetical protein
MKQLVLRWLPVFTVAAAAFGVAAGAWFWGLIS